MIDILPVESRHYGALADFLSTFDRETRPRDFWINRFRGWWDENPALQAIDSRGWMIQDGERVSGFLGGIPLHYRLRGSPTRVCGATTWRVHPDHRLLSTRLILEQMNAWKSSAVFFNTPSDRVREILKALRFQALPASRTGRMSIMLNLRPLNPVFLLTTALAKRSKAVAQADATFDALWERTQGRYANTSARDARTLNWYCFSGPKELRKSLLGHYDNGKLTGYAIFYRRPWGKRAVFELLDLWIEPQSGPSYDAIATSLIGGAARQAREQGCRFVLFRHLDPAFASLLWRKGVFFSKQENWSHYIHSPGDALKPAETGLSCLEGDFAL